MQNGSCDTIVCSKKILNDSNFPFDETEYFVVIGQDTSAYSCIIISENNKWGRADLEFALNENIISTEIIVMKMTLLYVNRQEEGVSQQKIPYTML